MTNELRKVYVAAGLGDRFWDDATPTSLWRAQKKSDFDRNAMLLEPHPGSETRTADVRVVERDKQQFVLGCRCVKGDYRGVSTFDMKGTWFGSRTTQHFRIPADTQIPPGLAVTRDHRNAQGAYHYTIAPKDDMPRSLFLQQLKTMSQHAMLEL